MDMCRVCATEYHNFPSVMRDSAMDAWHYNDHARITIHGHDQPDVSVGAVPFYGSVRDEQGRERAMPVYTPDGRRYHDGAVGPRTNKILEENQRAYEAELHDPRNTIRIITEPTRERTPNVFGLADIVQWVGWMGTLGVGIYYVFRWLA